MSNVIKRTIDSHGKYRYIRDINLVNYPVGDWVHDPDVGALEGSPYVAERYWKVVGDAVVEMSQLEKDAVDFSLKEADAIHNEHGEFIFGNRGKTQNRWLKVGGVFQNSDKMPTIVFNDGRITGLSYVNYYDSTDTNLEIYINGSLAFTWEVRDKRYAYKTNGLATLIFSAGDRISVRMKKYGSNTPMFPVVTLQYKYDSRFTGEGGSSTL